MRRKAAVAEGALAGTSSNGRNINGDRTNHATAARNAQVVAATQMAFTIPLPAGNAFLFRRALLDAIRSALSQAHVDGLIDVQTAVRCLSALPMPADQPR
jgi:hypothetical protein